MNLLTDFCFLDSVPLLSRGWIVPVGGSTPDRLKNRLKDWLKLKRSGPAREKSRAGKGAAFSFSPSCEVQLL